MLLRQLYEQGHYAVVQGPLEWREAVRKSAEPLVNDGSVEPSYVECLVNNIEKFGPYIVLIPGVAMPHAMEGATGALKTAISLMVVDQPVHFGEEDNPETDAQVFFTLSDVDAESHLQNMQRLVQVMSNEEVIERLKNMTDPKELLEIDKLVGDE